jgi:hypothetical protein
MYVANTNISGESMPLSKQNDVKLLPVDKVNCNMRLCSQRIPLLNNTRVKTTFILRITATLACFAFTSATESWGFPRLQKPGFKESSELSPNDVHMPAACVLTRM